MSPKFDKKTKLDILIENKQISSGVSHKSDISCRPWQQWRSVAENGRNKLPMVKIQQIQNTIQFYTINSMSTCCFGVHFAESRTAPLTGMAYRKQIIYRKLVYEKVDCLGTERSCSLSLIGLIIYV